METAERCMDAALHTGQQELAALQEENVEEAAVFADERHNLMEKAWTLCTQNQTPQEKARYQDKLVQLLHLQKCLTAEATQMHDKIRQSLMQARKEHKRMAGYRAAVGYAL